MRIMFSWSIVTLTLCSEMDLCFIFEIEILLLFRELYHRGLNPLFFYLFLSSCTCTKIVPVGIIASYYISISFYFSGGITRDWIGVPRKFYEPGSTKYRCACVYLADKLSAEKFIPYDDCPPTSPSCHVAPEKT